MDNSKTDGNKGLSRRSFIKGSAGVMALAAMGGGLAYQAKDVFAGADSADRKNQVEYVNGFCDGCLYKKCRTRYAVKDGVLLSVEGHPDGLYNQGNLCSRGQAQVMTLYNPWRTKTPLKRTNPKKGLDEDPKWVEISWEEALATTAQKIKEAKDKDPRLFAMFSGFGAMHSLYMRPFATAIGTPNVIFSPGCFCSGHSGSEILHGSFVECADPKYCKFKIDIGRGQLGNGSADGETQGDVEAVQRGTRIVKVDPRNSSLFSSSEWVPIKPQTELAFLLSLEHVIVHELKTFDVWFVKNRTNATYLIGDDGFYIRHAQSNKPLVWDVGDNTAKEFDDSSIKDYALEGSFEVNGVKAQTAFQLIKQKIKEYTPEWQEAITTIPAAKVRQLAQELVTEARIGSTIDIDGITMPYRPACISIYKGLTNHQFGHVAYFTAMTINILLGAFDVPGGNLGFNNFKYAKDEDGHPKIYHLGAVANQIKFPPTTLDMTHLIPLAHDVGYQYTNTMKDPKKYWLDYAPKVGVFYGCNLFSKGGGIEEISQGLAALDFAAAIATVFDEHAHFADIILPEASHFETDFCYERVFERPSSQRDMYGPMGARKALVKPLYDGRQADEILMDLAARIGTLPPTNGMAKGMNGIKGDIPPTNTQIKVTFNAWIEGKYGPEWDFDKVAEQGQIAPPTLAEHEIYQYSYAPDNQIRLPIYNIYLQKTRVAMLDMLEKAGAEHPAGNDTIREIFQPIPHWFEGTELAKGKDGFDMNLIGWRTPQFLHDVNNTSGNPILQEVAGHSPYYGKLILNTERAEAKGLKDGDRVYVENQHGVKIGPVPVKTSETIHPDAAGVAGGHSRKAFGMDPVNHTTPVSWNRLVPIAWRTIDPVSGAIEISPLIRITKA